MEKIRERRTALVTGSGKGVGAGIVKVLCAEGFRCCINCNSNKAMAEETLRRVQEAGGEAFLFPADVSDPDQVRAMTEATAERYGGIDLLVNNAAMQYNRFIDEYDLSTLERLWSINAGGYLRMINACRPYLKNSGCGRVVNIGSVHGKRPTCFDAGYAMTKGAIRMLTREAALELAVDGITVNEIDLGGCRIEFKTGNPPFHSWRPPEVFNPKMIRSQRLVVPEEVGHLVLYLASPEAAAVTGACLRLDGGQMLV